MPYMRVDYVAATKKLQFYVDQSGGGCCGDNRRDWQLLQEVDAMGFVQDLQGAVGSGSGNVVWVG